MPECLRKQHLHIDPPQIEQKPCPYISRHRETLAKKRRAKACRALRHVLKSIPLSLSWQDSLSTRWRRKVALPFLFLFLQVFSVFSEKSFFPFCMGNFKKRSKILFSFSFSGFSQFSQRKVFSFLLHLAYRCKYVVDANSLNLNFNFN
jgi:hypothetical protein